MSTSRAFRKIADQYNKPQLKIHKIVSAAIELGCTNWVGISRSLLIEHLAQKYGDSEQKWENRVAQTFSEDNNEYGQYFCRDGEQITFHPAVWQEIVRVGWASEFACEEKAVDNPSQSVAAASHNSEASSARSVATKRASLNIAAWGTFALEVIGSAASDKNKTGYFRSDVGVERLKAAVESGATFLFVHVAGSITRAFAISSYALQQACSAHKVSINNNGTPRYELYINYRKGEICKNAGSDGFVAAFDNIVNS